MSGLTIQNKHLNLLRNANQIQQIGNPSPPPLDNVSDKLLKSSGAGRFSLIDTKTVSINSDKARASCLRYTGLEGLRQLQKDQINNSVLQPGCGWLYKESPIGAPIINRAAVGTATGPSFGTLSRTA